MMHVKYKKYNALDAEIHVKNAAFCGVSACVLLPVQYVSTESRCVCMREAASNAYESNPP